MFRFGVLLIAMTLWAGVAYAVSPVRKAASRTVILSGPGKGETIVLRVGDRVVVQLSQPTANPYQWTELARSPKYLTPDATPLPEAVAPKPQKEHPHEYEGGQSAYVRQWRALRTGTTALKLGLTRGGPPIETYLVRLKITPKP